MSDDERLIVRNSTDDYPFRGKDASIQHSHQGRVSNSQDDGGSAPFRSGILHVANLVLVPVNVTAYLE